MRRLELVLLTALAFPAAAQITERLPLPVSISEGTNFETSGTGVLGSVLVGFLIPATGPVTSLAPLFSELGADGKLSTPVVGAWVGPPMAKTTRIEKAGSAVAGLRILVTVDGAKVNTRQFQVLWKAWTDGELSSPATDSRVYGEAAGATDSTKIIELRATGTAWVSGLHGRKLDGKLSQFSLLTKTVAKTASSSAATAVPTAQPLVAPVAGPVAPVVEPLAPPVLLKR